MEALRRLKGPSHETENARLNPWDVAYYANLQAKEQFRLDQEELRRYFPLPRVLDGLFSLAERLYGIRVAEVPAGEGRRSRGDLASGRALFHH